MFRARFVVLVCFVACFGMVAFAQDKDANKGAEKKKDDPKKDDKGKETTSAGRVRGMLPPNYRKLGLGDDQKIKIYKVQDEFDQKIKEAEERIAKLKAEKNKAVENVLTDAQKARLKEIISGKMDKDKADK